MALVSPGLSLTVTDESQYVPGAVGSVPLVLLATAQDKLNPCGIAATGTPWQMQVNCKYSVANVNW